MDQPRLKNVNEKNSHSNNDNGNQTDFPRENVSSTQSPFILDPDAESFSSPSPSK